ncbi:MAG TPA: amylo-alpha-1,6-glucosidase [Nitrolancea sp.]|nr:amylo-alpha-1,6-glucosidase [Nitrolancea sp.]
MSGIIRRGLVRYTVHDAPGPVRLQLEPFVTYRDDHNHLHGDPAWRFQVEARLDVCRVLAFPGAIPLWLRVTNGRFTETGLWYWQFLHRQELLRGLDATEDLYTPGVFDVEMARGEAVTLIATINPDDVHLNGNDTLRQEQSRQARLLLAQSAVKDPIRERLILAADQFVVKRDVDGSSVIAGYHWFTDWGRDTMIALPGLCLTTGRFREARSMLTTFIGYLSQGLLPNRFPDAGQAPEYNTADATLWFFETLKQYEQTTGDTALIDLLLPSLCDIVAWHQRGTLHGIGVDPGDGLLRAGADGLQLTWMDAKVGDWVVTPRAGKPVEIQGLWYNALRLLADWLAERGRDGSALLTAAEHCRTSFNRRFWLPDQGFCSDVVGGLNGDDHSLRPNQLMAASLTHPVLAPELWKSMLGTVEHSLLTPVGLRTLAPDDQAYIGTYAGGQYERDGAYHQGTVWPWLFGPYITVARRVHGDLWDSSAVLAGLTRHVDDIGLGQLSEIFDGDVPHRPAGCIAQAWSVAELLRVQPERNSINSDNLGQGA